jgi:hypothetical protein
MNINPHEHYRFIQEKMEDELRKAEDARRLREAFPPRLLRVQVADLLQRIASHLNPQRTEENPDLIEYGEARACE